MPNKTQIYAQMADDTARKITGDYLDWAAFLNTSSRLYKYPFHDQLMMLQGYCASDARTLWHGYPVCI